MNRYQKYIIAAVAFLGWYFWPRGPRLREGQVITVQDGDSLIVRQGRTLTELRLIEPLRTLRMLHYNAWLAKRWDDPAFPRAFPWFAGRRYWEEQILSLRQQAALLDEPPLTWEPRYG